MKHNKIRSTWWSVALLLTWAWVPTGAENEGPDVTSPEPERTMIEQQIRSRIVEEPGLGQAIRTRMESNLRLALRLELRDDQIEALFPMSERRNDLPADGLLQLQQRVIEAARSGLSADLLADKVREGRMKRVEAAALNRAVDRQQLLLQAAQREMTRARNEGVAAAPDPGAGLRLQRGIALNLWRGLNEPDLSFLRERARDRARDGKCSTVELAAAAETATELIEIGVDRQRARELVGTGLRQGYGALELREMGRWIRAASHRGSAPEEMLGWLEQRVRARESSETMLRQMLHHGWLGPRDMAGPGAQSPVDSVIDGPGRHGGGTQGSGAGSGSGSGSGSGGSPGQKGSQ